MSLSLSFHINFVQIAKDGQLHWAPRHAWQAAASEVFAGSQGPVLLSATDLELELNQHRGPTLEIFKEKVGASASCISQFPEVRKALLQGQRDLADLAPGLVAEGRDCGTVVFPEARMKFFLTASQEDRAQRRAQESGGNLETERARQQERDRRDQMRKTAPLAIPVDAEVLDTTGFTLKEVLEQVAGHVRSRGLL